MERSKKHRAPEPLPDDTRPARKSSEIQPAKKSDVALETYEQSPERQGTDERSRAATPDGPLPDSERVLPD